MIIGMILDSSYPPDPRVENEALSLINKGHQVFLFCITYTGNNKIVTETIKGINVNRYKLPKLLYSFSALAYSLPLYHYALMHPIADFIKKNSIEIIHIHDISVAKSVFKVNTKYNLPIILDLHENRPEIMKYYDHVRSFFGKLLIYPEIWKKYEYKYIKKADYTIVVTDDAKKYYLKKIELDKNKIIVVPNTVNTAFYSEYIINQDIVDRYKNNYTLLYLGDTGFRRGLSTAISAINEIIKSIPNLKLVIVGKSKSDKTLKNLVIEKDVQNYVEFVGWKDISLFPSYIIACDIGISPLHKNIHHDTTYANKIFQYLAFGKPIIVSNCTAQENIVKKYNCGLVFEQKESKDFAKKVISLHNDKDMYDSFSKNGQNAIIKNLNWEIISNELLILYNKYEKGKI